MLNFSNDYSEGCHPKVLEALSGTNMVSTPGYGQDSFCEEAKALIRSYIECPDADIYFMVGGTQTNQVIIDSMLSNYDGVIAAETGHIACHEAGAIEYSGHKVITVPNHEGLIDPDELNEYLSMHYADENHEHMVNPGMVYISYPSEYGTLYSKEALEKISGICSEYDIPLFIDGARLAYGLAASDDINIKDIARLSDVFYIGGTKVGALFGEAVVFTKNNTPRHFITQIKQHGALLAKGRLLGVQFKALFTGDLYMRMGRNAIMYAREIREDLIMKNYRLFIDSPTNQLFVVMSNSDLKEFGKSVSYGYWEPYDVDSSVIRIATSWSTSEADVEALKKIL